MAWITAYQRWLSESESLNNAQMVADHFSNWSNEAIAALCGNMRHESSINPDMYEYGYAWGSNRGYGLVQWTPRSKYWDWATARGLSPRLGDSQLARIDYEVEQNIQWIPISRYNGMTFKQFRENAGGWSVDYLTEAFTWSYERPNATAGANSMAARKSFARLVLATVDFSGEGGGGGIMPLLPVPEGTPISSSFNLERVHPVTGVVTPHYGTDFAAAQGTPLYATMAGVVTHASEDSVRGKYVIVKHDNDKYYSTYQHNVSNAVSVGDRVEQGDTVGYMGETGLGTGVHLHFAISDTPFGNYSSNPPGNFIDPEIYLQTPASGGGGGGQTPTPSQASRPLQPTLYQYEEETPNMTYYQVKKGDSLSAIAARYDVPMSAIQNVQFTHIANVNRISVGQVLKLPKTVTTASKKPTPAKTHTVKAGENLSVIAKRYKTSVAAIQMKNGIKDANHIVKGQVLKV